MLFYLKNFVDMWLFPPDSNLLLMLIGFLSWKYFPRLGKTLVIISLISLWLFSTPIIAQLLINRLQNQYPTLLISQITTGTPTAIVVLEAGLNLQTPEYGNQPTVS